MRYRLLIRGIDTEGMQLNLSANCGLCHNRGVAALETRIPPVVQWAVAAAITWVAALMDLDGTPLAGPAFDAIGVVVALAGLALGVSGGRLFSRASTTIDPHRPDETSSLVTGGVYRFTRNPMYLGLTFIVVGWALFLGSVVGLIVGPGFLLAALTRLQIKPEERVLADKFADEYEAFRRRTRRWL